MSANTSRRDFLKTAVVAGAAVGFPTIIPASALGKDGAVAPSERATIGVIGCGNRSKMTAVYENYAKAEVLAVCDPIRDRLLAKLKTHPNAKDYNDFRDVLARKDIDAVHIATGDHWHVPISLAAARAGKDMYTEKPLGVSVEEDLAAREIINKHNRILQYGTQNRSMVQVRYGLELALNGYIGDVKEIYVWAPPGHFGGSATPVLPVPDGFDYEMWIGPAPYAPYCEDRIGAKARKGIFHIYDYAIGFIAGWGAHPVDQLQWWADQMGMGIPVEYKGMGTLPTGGLFNTITHWDVETTYANGLKMRFLDNETRQAVGMPHSNEITFKHCALFVGAEGWVAVKRGACKVFPESLLKEARALDGKNLIISTQHQENFVDCVLERKQPVSDLASAVQSDLICHLSNISIRTGKTIQWDPDKETIVGNAEAKKMMCRKMRKPWTL